MPLEEKNYDSAVWTIHSLKYESSSAYERMSLLNRLAYLPFKVVVEIATRDGFNIYELIDFICKEEPLPDSDKIISLVRWRNKKLPSKS